MKMKFTLKTIALASMFALVSVAPLFAQEAQPEGKKQERGGVMGALFGQDPKEKKGEQKKDETPKTMMEMTSSGPM